MVKYCVVEIKKRGNEGGKVVTEYDLAHSDRDIKTFRYNHLKAWLAPRIAAQGAWSFRAFEIVDKTPGLNRVYAAVRLDEGYKVVENGFGEMKFFFSEEEVDRLYQEYSSYGMERWLVFLSPAEDFGCRSFPAPNPR